MAKQRERFSDQVRRHVAASGLSRYRIWKETGISQATLSRFMDGLTGLSMEYLDKVADLLRLNVISDGSAPAAAKRKER